MEKMFVANSLTGEVWVNLVGSNDRSCLVLSFRVDFHCRGKVARKPKS